jgi:hypothetical protein
MPSLSQKIDLIFSSFYKLSILYRGPTPFPLSKVDSEIVTAILKNDLADFISYKEAIIQFLEKDKTESRS